MSGSCWWGWPQLRGATLESPGLSAHAGSHWPIPLPSPTLFVAHFLSTWLWGWVASVRTQTCWRLLRDLTALKACLPGRSTGGCHHFDPPTPCVPSLSQSPAPLRVLGELSAPLQLRHSLCRQAFWERLLVNPGIQLCKPRAEVTQGHSSSPVLRLLYPQGYPGLT